MCERLCVRVCRCICAHLCARSREERGIDHLNLASRGDESKAKFGFKSEQPGQEGFPRLTRLSAARSGTGWQAGGSEQPISGESFVVSRPLGPAVAAPGAGDPECSSDKHMPGLSAGGWGEEEMASGSGFLVCRKQREKRQEPAGQREVQALLGLDGERGSRQEVAPAPGQTLPCQPLPWQASILGPPGSQSLRQPELPDSFLPVTVTSSLLSSPSPFSLSLPASPSLDSLISLWLSGLLSPSVHLALFFSRPSASPNLKASLC